MRDSPRDCFALRNWYSSYTGFCLGVKYSVKAVIAVSRTVSPSSGSLTDSALKILLTCSPA